jgi:hypothetical protein
MNFAAVSMADVRLAARGETICGTAFLLFLSLVIVLVIQ